MAHESRTQIDAVWINGYLAPRADWESLDAKVYRGVNGDLGGSWAPTTPIVLTSGTTALEVTGPTLVMGHGWLTLGDDANITLSDNDYPELMPGHVGRERTILQSTIPCMSVESFPWAVGVNTKHACAQPLALTLKDSSTAEFSPEFLVPLRVHNGSTLESVTFTFRVPEQRTKAPAKMPRFRVFAVDKNGVTFEMKATALLDGFESPKNPGSAEGWYLGGAAQEHVYVCDQNNVIDVAVYRYFAHIVEEGGATEYPGQIEIFTSAPIRRISAGVSYGVTPDAGGFATATESDLIDGAAFFVTGGQQPSILKDQDNPSDNGLWQPVDPSAPDPNVVSPGKQIIRSPFLDGGKAGAPYTGSGGPAIGSGDGKIIANGTLFPAGTGGTENSYTVWQIVLPTPFVLGTSPVHFVPPVPRGNIYHSLSCRFTGIVDDRPQ